MKRFSFGMALFVTVSFCGGTSAFAQNGSGSTNQNNLKISRDLQNALRGGADTQRVIISVKSGYRASVRRALELHGDLIRAEHPSIDALSGVVHSSDIAELARQPWIESVAADSLMFAIGSKGADSDTKASSAKGSPASGSNGPATNLYLRETLGLPAVASPGTPAGSGIVVGVIDSGLAPSRDLPASRIVGFYDFTQEDKHCAQTPAACAAAPFDPFGHGTHVAGLIGGGGALSGGLYQGVAPDVKFLAIRVLDEKGQGFASNLIAALEFVTKNRTLLKVRVVNLSLGSTITMPAILDPIVRAVEQASAAGITVVVAAGNNPRGSENAYGGITTPANAPSALTTGATDTQLTVSRGDDVVAEFSARGPTWFDGLAKPDFVSPGTNLISDIDPASALYQQLPKNRVSVNGNPFLRLTGTSMGAGVASGVAALVLQAQHDAFAGTTPWLTPNAVKAILEYTAIPVTKGSPDVLTQGAGQLNAIGAISLAKNIDTSTKLGGFWLVNGVSATSTIGSKTYAWGQNIIWGTRVLGGNLVYHNLLIWSRNIIWGTNILWGTTSDGDSILWGTLRNIVVAGHHDLAFAMRIVAGVPTMYVSGNRTKVNNILWGTFTGPVVKASNIIWGTVAIWGRRLTEGRVLGLQEGDNILWGTTGHANNILWGTERDSSDNILWGTWDGDNILWGTWDGDNILWGTWNDGDSILWGTTFISSDGDSIIWGSGANIVWGTGENIIWGTGENIVWGTGENIVWGTGENIVWGTGENIIWGTDGNIVWGTFRSGGAF